MPDRCRARACQAEALETSRYCAVHASAETISAAVNGSSEALPEEPLHREIEEGEETLGGFTAPSVSGQGAVTPEDADRRCSGVKADGERCGAWTVKGEALCAGHLGIGAKAQRDARDNTPVGYTGILGRKAPGNGNGSTVSAGAHRDEARVRTRLRDLALDHKTPAAAAVAAGRAFLDPTYDADEDEDVMPAWLRDPRAYEGLTEAQHLAVLEARPSNLAGVIRALVDHGLKGSSSVSF